ncbi:MAG: hypothetical protein HC921_00975 [Synechococcaceae cyanobacterium SM2_3_1]|nr:hypothetical protein [Synechococcaceae cyanobacterium SM2_3_1]
MEPLIFQERCSQEKGVIRSGRLLELHLYPGNHCNRDCSFCTVFGSPAGEFSAYTAADLDAALAIILWEGQGTLKFYGGEPTLHLENLLWAIQYIRQQGFPGAMVIYSNGILADRLIQVLQSDPLGRTTASLNYSITTGNGAPAMPRRSLEILLDYERMYPGSIAIGHADIVDSGRGVTPFQGDTDRPKHSHRCPHCYPVLLTSGQFHACPFAVELKSPHFHLGDRHSPSSTVTHNFQIFLEWLDQVHEPYAKAQDLPACSVCWHHLEQLPVPEFSKELDEEKVSFGSQKLCP